MSPQASDQGVGSAAGDLPKHQKVGDRRLGLMGWLLAVFWYLLGLWAVLAVLARVVAPAWQTAGTGIAGWAAIGQGVLALLLLLVGFVLVDLGCRASLRWVGTSEAGPTQIATGKESTQAAAGKAFPTPPTLQVGVGVLSFAFLSLAAVVAMLHFGVNTDVRQAVLMTCAAGVGSSIATILGFLEHASEKANFNPAYAPWYVGRPVMGLLLGLLFFLMLRGGMLGVLPNLDAGKLNPYGLAAIGGMVGLFTKNAVEKLQEVFDVLFQTKNDVQEDLLTRLPADLRKHVEPYLAPEQTSNKGTQTAPQAGLAVGRNAKGDAPASETGAAASTTANDTAKQEPGVNSGPGA